MPWYTQVKIIYQQKDIKIAIYIIIYIYYCSAFTQE